MQTETHARSSDGGKVLIADVSDSDSFKGDYWVQFAQSGREHDAYTVDHFDSRSAAEDRADQVADVMGVN